MIVYLQKWTSKYQHSLSGEPSEGKYHRLPNSLVASSSFQLTSSYTPTPDGLHEPLIVFVHTKPPAEMRDAFQVLGDPFLFMAIMEFAAGTPFFQLRVKRQLTCTQPAAYDTARLFKLYAEPNAVAPAHPDDIALWQTAVRAGDKRTLEALQLLEESEELAGERLRVALKGIVSFVLLHARDTGDTELLDWIGANAMFPFDDIEPSMFFELGERGDQGILQWIHELEYIIEKEAANGAASGGNLDVLRFLHSLGSENAIIDSAAVDLAATNGHLHVLEFLMDLDKWDADIWNNAYSSVVRAGHLDIVQYLYECRFACRGDDIVKTAASDHVGLVKFVSEDQIAAHSRSVLYNAAQSGNLDVVRYLFQCDPERCSAIGYYLTVDAVKHGHFELVEFFHERGDASFFASETVKLAAEKGHFEIVRLLVEKRSIRYDSVATEYVRKKGQERIATYLCRKLLVEDLEHQAELERRIGSSDLSTSTGHSASIGASGTRKRYGVDEPTYYSR